MYSVDDILNGDIDDDDQNAVHEDEAIEDNTHNDEDDEVKKDEKDDDKPAKKVRKQSQRPLLNAERLKGPRGLICMEKTFSKLKFQGNGKEQQDLETVMTALQHWCHRLYPKYTFDDTVDQLEKLGIKKPVVVLRKKIIMNMLEDEIFALNKSEDEDEPELPSLDSPPPPRPKVDQFDLLFGEDRPPLKRKEPTPEQELTDEMQAMIERNRMLAAERRKARLEAQENKEKNLASVSNTESSLTKNLTEFEIENVPSTSHQKELPITKRDSIPSTSFYHKNKLVADNNLPSTSKKLSAFEQENLLSKTNQENSQPDEDSLPSSNIQDLPSFVNQETSMDVLSASQEEKSSQDSPQSSNIDLPSFVSQDTPMDIPSIPQEKMPDDDDSLPEKLQSEEDSLPSFVSEDTPMETDTML